MDLISLLTNTGNGLSALQAKASTIGNNIANASTPGFHAQRVSFEVVMDAAAGDGSPLTARLEPQVGLSVDGAVRLDSEVAAMAQNGAHYQALLKALNRHLSVLTSAVNDGKR